MGSAGAVGRAAFGLRADAAACGRLRRLGMAAGGRGRLLAVPSPETVEMRTALRPLPPGWGRRADDPSLVQTVGPGRVRGAVSTGAGRHELWLRGSFGRSVSVAVGGRTVASIGGQLADPAEWVELRSVSLASGRHAVELARGHGDLSPGSGDGPRTLGSLVLRRPLRRGPIAIPATRWHGLCGRSWTSVARASG
jgi:hypothetical protein